MAAKEKRQEVVANEGVERAEADNAEEQVQPEDQAPQGSAQGAEDGSSGPSEIFEVQLNPKLRDINLVQIGDKVFYADLSVNRSQGTSYLNDEEYDEVSESKEPESGLQYIVKKKGVN